MREGRVVRATTALIGMLIVVLSTAGCFFQTRTRADGATGVSADARGLPVLVIAVCAGQMENVFLTEPQGGHETTIGEWHIQRVSARTVSVPVLVAPGPDWTVESAPARLQSTASYTALAESSDKKWQMRPIEFTLADVATLNADTVLYDRGRVSRTDFYAKACPK